MSPTNISMIEDNLHELNSSTSFTNILDVRSGNIIFSTSDKAKECHLNVRKYYQHVLTLSEHFENAMHLLMSIENEVYPLSNYNDDGLSDDDIVYITHAPASLDMILQVPNQDDEQIELRFSKTSDQIWMSDYMQLDDIEVETAKITFNFRLDITLKDGDVYYYLDWIDSIDLDDDLNVFKKNLNEKFNPKDVVKIIQMT